MIDKLDSAADDNSALFTRYNAATAGVVEYYIDGYEDASLDDLNADWFDETKYQRQNLRTNELVSSGDPAYKLVTDENWKLVFPLDAEMESYILDKMQANQRTAGGRYGNTGNHLHTDTV